MIISNIKSSMQMKNCHNMKKYIQIEKKLVRFSRSDSFSSIEDRDNLHGRRSPLVRWEMECCISLPPPLGRWRLLLYPSASINKETIDVNSHQRNHRYLIRSFFKYSKATSKQCEMSHSFIPKMSVKLRQSKLKAHCYMPCKHAFFKVITLLANGSTMVIVLQLLTAVNICIKSIRQIDIRLLHNDISWCLRIAYKAIFLKLEKDKMIKKFFVIL